MPEAGDIETISVPIEVRVVVQHPTTEDTLHESHVTSGRTRNSSVRNLAEGAFSDEPELPEVNKPLVRKRGKLSKLFYALSLSVYYCSLLMDVM